MYYTCRSKVRSTLRVQSKYWNGVKLYSGITENTVLSPVHLSLPVATGTEMSDPNCELGVDDLDQRASAGDESVHDASHANNTNLKSPALVYGSSPRPQTVPLVTWNERTSAESSGENTRRSVKVTAYKIFQPEIQRNLRPVTAGARILVPPKYNCPAGLTPEDVVRGMKLSRSPQRESLELNNIAHGKIVSNELHRSRTNEMIPSDAARQRFTALPRQFQSANANRRQEQESYVARQCRPHTTPNPKRCVTFELHIKSLGSRSTVENSKLEASVRYKCNDRSDFERGKDASIQVKKIRSDADILEMKRRVQSAPPNAKMTTLQNRENVKDHHCAKTPAIEERKFSNMYWRAKSSYHKKMADPDNDAGQSYGPQKGTLLRPLLYNDDAAVMKHSAGCPYKCKECFKACLVSEDFMDTQSRVNAQKTTTKRPSQPDPLAIVRRALARSQPIFKQVYGDHFDVNVRPWPTYAWVDIRQTLQKDA